MIKSSIKKIVYSLIGKNLVEIIKSYIGFAKQLHNHNPKINLFYSIVKNKINPVKENCIIFNSLPKSGNSGIATSLLKNSKLNHGDISRLEYSIRTSDYGYISNHKQIIKKYVSMGGFLINGHYWANSQDLEFLLNENIKIMVHFRNPCDSIRSLFDYMQKHNSKIMKYWFRSHYINLSEYLNLNDEEREKLVFQKNIKRYFKFIIEWTKAREILKDNLFITQYEDLESNETNFLKNIYSFFNVSHDNEVIFHRKKFNKGVSKRGEYLYHKYSIYLDEIIKEFDKEEYNYIEKYLIK